jgi:hypothetical protein
MYLNVWVWGPLPWWSGQGMKRHDFFDYCEYLGVYDFEFERKHVEFHVLKGGHFGAPAKGDILGPW